MTRDIAAAFLDGLDDAGLTRLISELLWYEVTRRGVKEGEGTLADLRRLMASAAREHVLDRLTGEPETEPLPGRAT